MPPYHILAVKMQIIQICSKVTQSRMAQMHFDNSSVESIKKFLTTVKKH